jgi:NAD(P)H-flavin reductase
MPKHSFELKSNINFAPNTQFATFYTKSEINCEPGKFFSIEVSPGQRRAYSTVECSKQPPQFFLETQSLPIVGEGAYVSFMVSTKAGGLGSQFFADSKPGAEVSVVGPAGAFKLHSSDRPKIFVATGTGLAPFVPMISQVLSENPETKIYLFFAVWTQADDYAKQFFTRFLDKEKYPNFTIYTVIDQFEEDQLSEFVKGGRVTTVIPEMVSDFADFDYYLCGHPAMVAAMEEVLVEKEVSGEQIHKEKFA